MGGLMDRVRGLLDKVMDKVDGLMDRDSRLSKTGGLMDKVRGLLDKVMDKVDELMDKVKGMAKGMVGDEIVKMGNRLMHKVKAMVVDKILKMGKPTVFVTGVGIKSVTRKAVGLKSDVRLHNPYSHDLPILEINYRLRCGDREITSGSVGNTGVVAANSDTSIEVVSTVAFDFLINLMRDVGSDGDIDYDFDVGVKLKLPIVHSFTIPLHKKGTLKLPTLSDFM